MKPRNKDILALVFAVMGFVWMYFTQYTPQMAGGLVFIGIGSFIVITNWIS